MLAMYDDIVLYQERIGPKLFFSGLEAQGAIRTGFDAQRLLRFIPAIQAKITAMDQIRHMLRINGAVRTRVRTGFATDATHRMTDQ